MNALKYKESSNITSTTSVPPFWMRFVRYSISCWVKEEGGLTCIKRCLVDNLFREILPFTEQNQKHMKMLKFIICFIKRPETEEAGLSLLNDLQQLEHQLPSDQAPEFLPAKES